MDFFRAFFSGLCFSLVGTDIALVIGGDGTWEGAEIDESALEDVATFWDFAALAMVVLVDEFSVVDCSWSSAFWTLGMSLDGGAAILATGEGEIFDGDGVVEF